MREQEIIDFMRNGTYGVDPIGDIPGILYDEGTNIKLGILDGYNVTLERLERLTLEFYSYGACVFSSHCVTLTNVTFKSKKENNDIVVGRVFLYKIKITQTLKERKPRKIGHLYLRKNSVVIVASDHDHQDMIPIVVNEKGEVYER